MANRSLNCRTKRATELRWWEFLPVARVASDGGLSIFRVLSLRGGGGV